MAINLMSWNKYRKLNQKPVYVNIHREMTRDGFHLYVDTLDVRFTVCKGETPFGVAKELLVHLRNDKQLRQSSDVIWTRNGQYIALYYKTTNPTQPRPGKGQRARPMESKELSITGAIHIQAANEDALLLVLREVEMATLLSTGGFDCYEQDEDTDTWKVLLTATLETVDELREAISYLDNREDVYLSDSILLVNDEYAYCEGQYLGILSPVQLPV